jgi:hypothetical protein
MIGGEWKRPESDRQSPLLILFRLVAFWGRSAMGWSVPFSLGEVLVEGLLADCCG